MKHSNKNVFEQVLRVSDSMYFSITEFRRIQPDYSLLLILNRVRQQLNQPVTITDSARTLPEHIAIYKKLYPDSWERHIPWESRHLPKHDVHYLRAVDFKSRGYKGWQLADLVHKNKPEDADKGFIHLDTDRANGDRVWTYGY